MSASPKLKVVQGHVYATSLDVAQHFQKSHKHVLDSIENLLEMPANGPKLWPVNADDLELIRGFNLLNFEETAYTDSKGESRPAYRLTRDGFALIAMGFTGPRAVAWKIRYITAFNEMERRLQIQSAKSGQFQQLALFPDLQQTVADTRPTMTLAQAVGIIAYQGLNIPPVTRDHLARLVDKGVIAGCRESGRRVVYVDSFNHWLKLRRQAA